MSKIEVNQISSQCGSTLTIGQSGDTVTLASGATQTGFGRTGTVDWCTTAKTAPFTGVSGKGYFVNTTCGAVTVTLPATPTAGDIISIADYASTFQTNNVTLCRNSSKINGVCANASLSTQGQSITLVYVDATKGWKNTMDSTSNVTGVSYITATGGTISCCGNYKIHTFTSDGTFCVSSISNQPANNEVSYIVVAGGGGGGSKTSGTTANAGGGGAGGFREKKVASDCYTASPLEGSSPITVTATGFPITVGGGGAGGAACANAGGSTGSNSVFSTITSAGGGFGNSPGGNGGNGGSGGGGPAPSSVGGTGNTPPVSPPQGNNGGIGTGPYPGPASAGGAGGGAGAAGPPADNTGGVGVTTSISASPTAYAGGGGGGRNNNTPVVSPCGTGGKGGNSSVAATSGTTNRGGGGGGAALSTSGAVSAGGSGGSGVVIIRYKYQ